MMRRAIVCTMAAVLGMGAGKAGATVTLTASRPDVLYTTDDQFDCGDLAGRMDGDLPYNIVRLRAADDTGQATSFRWRLPKPNVGFLMPDDPTIDSSAGGAFALQGFCAEIGSGCVFTEDTIQGYRRPTILWAAPTCETALPANTRGQFGGDTVTIRVKADGLRGRAAKASTEIGYGRLGTPVLWVTDTRREPDDGIGTKLIVTDLLPTFSVTLDAAIMPPVAIRDYIFDNGGGKQQATTTCLLPAEAAPGAPACARLAYDGAGPFRPRVEVRLADDSAYCDNATVRVATCRVRTRLEVDRSPRKATYRSGDTGEVTVTLRNLAPRADGCTFIFDRLTCQTTAKRGGFEATSGTVTFEPARCEKERLLFCNVDADCGALGPCLNQSHCSETTEVPCVADRDCSPRECQTCQAGEQCVRVVQVPPVLLPGDSAELVRDTAELRSVLPGRTRITETWQVKEAFNRGNAERTDRYKIRGEPVQ